MAIKQLKQLLGQYLDGPDYKDISDLISIQKIWKKDIKTW